MSNNKNLAKRLEAMRLKAKKSVSAEPPLDYKPDEQSPPSQFKGLFNLKTATKPVQSPALSPDIERTTITLKSGDNEALSELQTFLMQRVRKAASTSTLIRLALLYTKQSLSSDVEALEKVYVQILEEDGRRKVVNSQRVK